MDLLSEHEGFLRAIYDALGDDTPRLVYADFLEEHDLADLAQWIRLHCDWARLGRAEQLEEGQLGAIHLAIAELRRNHPPGWPWKGAAGLPSASHSVAVTLQQLLDPQGLRAHIVSTEPQFFGASEVQVVGGPMLSPEPLEALFGLTAFARMKSLNLRGATLESRVPEHPEMIDYVIKPVITSVGIEALVRHRGVRRLTSLNLTYNNLDNDAAYALVKSPYLDNLKRLELFDGNRFRGRVWQKVIERFGEDVVG
jgi:uncharacterized protein (TIGR02996 family)